MVTERTSVVNWATKQLFHHVKYIDDSFLFQVQIARRYLANFNKDVDWVNAEDDDCLYFYKRFGKEYVERAIGDKRNNVTTELKKVFYLRYGKGEGEKTTVCMDVDEFKFNSNEVVYEEGKSSMLRHLFLMRKASDCRLYFWFLEEFVSYVTGRMKFKTGAKQKMISEVVSVSDEAFALIVLENK